jgi:hypothetical protein
MQSNNDAFSHNVFSDELDYVTPYENFLFALKSKETQRQYPKLLKMFFDFINIEPTKPIEERSNIVFEKAKEDKRWFESQIFRYVIYNKQKVENKEIVAGTLKNYLKIIRLFCRMNDIEDLIHWNKIKISMPKVKEFADDRAPTIDEICKLVEYNDIRIKPIVYTMASSGIRLGAWDYLKWKHVIPIKDHEDPSVIKAAKLVVYAGEPEQYYTFITPEAYLELEKWMDLRRRHGENVTGESWILRDIWETRNKKYGELNIQASNPAKFNSTGVKTMLSRAWHHQGVWNPLNSDEKRHEFKLAHGFRKFFKSRTQQAMRHNNVKILMGHFSSMGLSKNYYKPTEAEVLDDYLKAVDLLTFSQNNKILDKKVKDLQEQNKNTDYIIKGKLQEKDEQIQSLTDQFSSMKNMLENLVKGLSETNFGSFAFF